MRLLVSIQHLRGLAALAVVSFHFAEGSGWVWRVGAAGVDVFFVISGFIMWGVTQSVRAPGAFLRERIVRILPLYWIATILLFLKNGARPADLLQSLLFIPYQPVDGLLAPVLPPGWTLNIEMFFYGLFALVLFLPRWAHLAVLTLVLSVLCLIGWVVQPGHAIAEAYTNPRLAEFLVGIWLGVAWQDGKLPNAGIGAVLIASGLGAFAACEWLSLSNALPVVLAYGLPSSAIVAGALSLEHAGLAPKFGPAKAIGDASYSLYLFHTIILSVLIKFLDSSPLIFLLGVPTSIVVALVAFRYVETPIGLHLKALLRRRSTPALAP